MKVLVIGSGAREHALVWKLAESRRVDGLFAAPGNGGTAQIATNVPIAAEDTPAVVQFAVDNGIDLTVVGPEAPLADGLVDTFRRRGLSVFGPTQQASQLEWSKAFARSLMLQCGVPSPDFKVFHDYGQATAFVEKHQGPLVVKADGLAAGKGALVCRDRAEASAALDRCMRQRAFGSAGATVVVEEFLTGREISVFAFCDGEHLSPMMAACDYKRALDGDQGPNTGGMGAYSPPLDWSPGLQREVLEGIMRPVVEAMAERGTPYQGVLYAGLMLTAQGPKVLEFNCRLGDPEAQVVLPLLDTDLVDVLEASVEERVQRVPLAWNSGTCVGVVMTSQGYPGEYRKGFPIHGIEATAPDVVTFHAGTRAVEGDTGPCCITDGGRVLTVVGCGETLEEARNKVYDNVALVTFQGATYRRDIGLLEGKSPRDKQEGSPWNGPTS